jgi:antitoxin MazE
MQVSIARWGNSLGVRLPRDIAARIGLREGVRVEVTAEDGRIVLTPSQPCYRLADLLVGMTPEAMHEAFDWGEECGRERVD